MKIRKLAYVPVLLLGALVSAALPPRGAAPGRAENLERTGVVEAWRLDMDGAMYVGLRTTRPAGGEETDSEAGELVWFRTPPDKELVLKAQSLLIEVLTSPVYASTPQKTLTLTAKLERALDGKSLERALPLVYVASP